VSGAVLLAPSPPPLALRTAQAIHRSGPPKTRAHTQAQKQQPTQENHHFTTIIRRLSSSSSSLACGRSAYIAPIFERHDCLT